MSANFYGELVDEVGPDWKGPLHQHEGGAKYFMQQTVPTKISLSAGWLLEHIQAGDSILDVGCYAGYLYEYLLKNAKVPFTYTGVDFNIEHAIEVHDTNTPVFVESDISLYWERHDWVYCARVLLHQPNPYEVLEHCVSLAKKQAVFTTLVGKEESIRRQDTSLGRVYRYTMSKEKLDAQYQPHWVFYKNNPDKYSVFVVNGS